MSELTCATPRCAIPRRHKEGCGDDNCRGCLPAIAAPGLRLCDLHTTRIATDALRCAELDLEVEQALAGSDRPGEKTSGTADHGTVINERAIEIRSETRHTLVAIARLISEERGIGLPPDTLDAIAAYIATHHVWLAAHPGVAGSTSDELSSLQRRAWNVAYPTGARVFPVGPCPTCGAIVKVVLRAVDSLLPSELVCDGEAHAEDCECRKCPPHRWPYTSWRNLGKKIHKRYLSPAEISAEWKMPLGSVYRHASEAKWRRAEDGRRPALYLVEDVRATLDSLASAEA